MPIQKITPGVVDTSVFSAPTISSPIISGNLSLDSTGTTGVRVPSANTLAFYEGGVEAMRIDSSGNIGVGTTSVTGASKFEVYGNSSGAHVGIRVNNAASDGYGTVWASIAGSNDGMIRGGGTAAAFANQLAINTSSTTPITFYTNSTERGRFDTSGNFLFNSGYGSAATAYGCRAWVNFNGTGTVAIRASGNVSSITDNGTGDYTINLTTAMPDVNYCTQLTGMRDSDGNGSFNATIRGGTYSTYVTTSSVRILAENDSGTRVDAPYYGAAFFR